MTNPIPLKYRGILYVISICVSGLALALVPVLAALGATIPVIAVTAITNSISLVVGALARDNLSAPTVIEGGSDD